MKRIISFALLAYCLSLPAYAELYFDINALQLSDEDRKNINLDSLAKTDSHIPGIYKVNVIVNQQDIGIKNLSFIDCGEKLCPELSVRLLKEIGVKTESFPELALLSDQEIISQPEKYIKYASADLDLSHLTLTLNFPQAAMRSQIRGDISPDQWDDGLPMFFTNYNLTGMQSWNKNQSEQNQYLNLRSGFNLGPWRVRHNSYYSRNSTTSEWKSLKAYAERDIRPLRSRLVLGETTTDSTVFDSFTFNGVKLMSDSQMLPDSQQRFAPVVRGIAMTHARIEVHQKDNLIYQTFVPPGAFEITDIYPTDSNGDLEISIYEENGKVRKFTQLFSASPLMIREGQIKYFINVGKFSGSKQSSKKRFIQTEVIYGLWDSTTIYSGTIASSDYQSHALGLGHNLGNIGAVSIDVTNAATHFPNKEKKTGQSYQIRYSKNFTTTNTTVTLAGYRYNTNGYFSFSDANNSYQFSDNNRNSVPKNRMQITMGQSLGQFGSLSLSTWQQDYWQDKTGKNQSYSMSYNTNIHDIYLSLGYNYHRNRSRINDDQTFSLNISIPLDKWLPSGNYSASVDYDTTYNINGDSQHTMTLSGSLLEQQNLSYSISQNYSYEKSEKERESGNAASLYYKGSYGSVNAGYTTNHGKNKRINYGLEGAIIVHPYGVTLAQNISESGASALIRAPGASHTKVLNNTSISTDWRGYTVVPYISQYRENMLSLDTNTFDDDVDIDNPTTKVIPTKGALVLADYSIRVGHRVFLTLQHKGKRLPFGAIITGPNGVNGMVNERGEVFLSGVSDTTKLTADLGDQQRCYIKFDSKKYQKINGIILASLSCQ
ncbi:MULTISPECIES: fimbria/pilus outer membrane usher protein [Photorhabdus]|uniref:Outer membrane protein n=2 Tax=Photorhabdus asymbiotica TaxID=291112 RepID=C7BNQ2_PHOAA|nr:fimbria/pilus outer membrane usher protein [Photorhabdus asymbiotica]RKS66965.1 outer membrane usher protein [Photorhabdus asymbiotica]CAQ83064.1 putative outer membrane protein [Photorhabdus asymbiotica]